MKSSVPILITFLTFIVNREVLCYYETYIDQVAEESKQRDYSTRVRAPASLLKDTNGEKKSLKKYGDRTHTRTYFNNNPKIIKLHNQQNVKLKTFTPTVPLTRTRQRIPSPPNRPQTDQYRIATSSIQVYPSTDPKNIDDGYFGWTPIVPKFEPDFKTKPQQELKQTKHHIISKPVRLQRQIPHYNKGYYKSIYPKYKSHYRRRIYNKIPMKRKNSSAFSGTQQITQRGKAIELETAESQHVKYKTKIKHHHHHHHHKYVQTVEKKVPYPVEKIVHKIVEKKVPYPVEKKVPYPVEKIVHKIVEKKVPYPVEKKVPYPVEKIVHKYIEKKVPYPVEKKVPYPVEVKVPQPYPVKVIEKEYIPKPYPVVKHVPIIKHIEVKVPVPQPVPYPVEKKVPYPVEVRVPYPVEKKVPYPVEVEKKVPYPVKVYIPKPYPVEKKVPYPVEVKVKEPYPVIKHIEVPVKVYIDKPYPVHVPKPYPVEVEKKVPYPVHVEKKVPVPVKVYVPHPYPVEKPYPVYIKHEEHLHKPEVAFDHSQLFIS